MFLFDPSQDPTIAGSLEAGNRRERGSVSQETIISDLVNQLRRFRGGSENERAAIPIIVAVSKFDLLHKIAGPIEELARLDPDSVYGSLNVELIKRTSEGVRRLLLDYSPLLVASVEAGFENVTFLPVSSFGVIPFSFDSRKSPEKVRAFSPEVLLLFSLHLANPDLIPASRTLPSEVTAEDAHESDGSDWNTSGAEGDEVQLTTYRPTKLETDRKEKMLCTFIVGISQTRSSPAVIHIRWIRWRKMPENPFQLLIIRGSYALRRARMR